MAGFLTYLLRNDPIKTLLYSPIMLLMFTLPPYFNNEDVIKTEMPMHLLLLTRGTSRKNQRGQNRL